MHVIVNKNSLHKIKEGITIEQLKAKYPDKEFKVVKVPSLKRLEHYSFDGVCPTPDGCKVEPDGHCEHGYKSWLMYVGVI
jgi:hypothetical protein